MGITIAEERNNEKEEGIIPSVTTAILYLKEFESRHQLLTWKQFATIENKHYKIHKMNLKEKTLLVEPLESGGETNGKVANIVRMSAA